MPYGGEYDRRRISSEREGVKMSGDSGRAERKASRPQAPASYAFSKRLKPLLPWSHVEERLERALNYWIATTRPDGRPHVTPVWGVWLDGALYMDGHPATRWARNLAANPALSVHLESGEDVVILEGSVEDVITEAETGTRIIAAWDAKYGRLLPDPSGGGIFRLRPRAVRAWSTSSLEDGTRWQLGET